MKQALRNSLIYVGAAAAAYFIVTMLPDYIGVPALTLFYFLHLPGVALVNLFAYLFTGASAEPLGATLFIGAIILINAALVFFISWIRSRP